MSSCDKSDHDRGWPECKMCAYLKKANRVKQRGGIAAMMQRLQPAPQRQEGKP